MLLRSPPRRTTATEKLRVHAACPGVQVLKKDRFSPNHTWIWLQRNYDFRRGFLKEVASTLASPLRGGQWTAALKKAGWRQ